MSKIHGEIGEICKERAILYSFHVKLYTEQTSSISLVESTSQTRDIISIFQKEESEYSPFYESYTTSPR